MIKTKNVKGIGEPVMVFGIKGQYFLLMLMIMSIIAIAFILLLLVSLLQSNFGWSALFFFGFILANALCYWVFAKLSKRKPFHGLSENIEVVSNQDLIKLLK